MKENRIHRKIGTIDDFEKENNDKNNNNQSHRGKEQQLCV